MASPSADPLAGLDPFDIFDTEAARLDRFFSSLDAAGWERPSRCAGWSVRDVLAHLAGEELYNHACLDGEIEEFLAMLEREGAGPGFRRFNDWCVARRRGVPVDEVLAEWRSKNAVTRARMRELGRYASLGTSAGPYPVGLQTFHYASEFATHADDVGAPVPPGEVAGRTDWRVRMGLFTLAQQGSPAEIERSGGRVAVKTGGRSAHLTEAEFVAATVARSPSGTVDPEIATVLRCLA